ncbi:helix-turn-helix domain-containing protein [Chryseobacterium tructae]|uniref:Helix-turn-helix domain-containing protein n=1 Tax=Chryseobacterium tructae TaxID=1037380 RepID=A0ABV7XZG0_9FLAO|nr:helix-turn-helix domain-containing protein [Chryseobacterium tructae]MDN3693584.1 helix-turn-helix domain-containing protein [Chryseobacterium tructae]
MSGQNNYTLINPNTGNLAFKIFDFENSERFDHIQRNNFFSLIFILEGSGEVKADFSKHQFQNGAMFAFSPYQPFLFSSDRDCKGFAVQFHPDFFCIHKHQNEVACNGVLFNNIYEPPFLTLNTAQQEQINTIVAQLKSEILNKDLAQYELLIAHLKILLIHLSRIKMEQQPEESKEKITGEKPFVLQHLKDAIEDHFKIKHSASEYAEMLNISSKALAKITKTHFNKTVTELISERIIIEAKRELYLTSKTVKEIANELGYQDEYYFSRFFKINADVSPQIYRDTVGFAVAEK